MKCALPPPSLSHFISCDSHLQSFANPSLNPCYSQNRPQRGLRAFAHTLPLISCKMPNGSLSPHQDPSILSAEDGPSSPTHVQFHVLPFFTAPCFIFLSFYHHTHQVSLVFTVWSRAWYIKLRSSLTPLQCLVHPTQCRDSAPDPWVNEPASSELAQAWVCTNRLHYWFAQGVEEFTDCSIPAINEH